MSRDVRALALVLGAVAMMLAPCMPALTWVAPCAMAGCDDDAGSRVNSATPCCCATTGTPATSGNSTAQKQNQTRPAHVEFVTDPAMSGPGAALALAAVVEPEVHVPIFLLNTSFLM